MSSREPPFTYSDNQINKTASPKDILFKTTKNLTSVYIDQLFSKNAKMQYTENLILIFLSMKIWKNWAEI